MIKSIEQVVLSGVGLGDREGGNSTSARGQVRMMFLATLLAVVAAFVVSSIQPQEANAASTVNVKACDGRTITLGITESRVFGMHNQARTANGLPKLCVHRILTSAARAHSQEMINKDYFAHNSFNGETVIARMQRFGYTSSGYSFVKYGENIYRGSGNSGSARSAHTWWMNSPGHRSNILDRDFREVGIGVRTGEFQGQAGMSMYTVDFGVRRR